MRALLKSLDEKVCFSVEFRWRKPKEEPIDGTLQKNSVAYFNSRFLNAILNDVPEKEIRWIQTIVVVGKHLVNHIRNFCHKKMTIRTKMKTY